MVLEGLMGSMKGLKLRVGKNSIGEWSDEDEEERVIADKRLLAVEKGAGAGAGAGSEGRWVVVVGAFVEEAGALVGGG